MADPLPRHEAAAREIVLTMDGGPDHTHIAFPKATCYGCEATQAIRAALADLEAR